MEPVYYCVALWPQRQLQIQNVCTAYVQELISRLGSWTLCPINVLGPSYFSKNKNNASSSSYVPLGLVPILQFLFTYISSGQR